MEGIEQRPRMCVRHDCCLFFVADSFLAPNLFRPFLVLDLNCRLAWRELLHGAGGAMCAGMEVEGRNGRTRSHIQSDEPRGEFVG